MGSWAASPRLRIVRARRRGPTRRVGAAYAMLAPALLTAGAFRYLPMLLSAYWSFTDYNGIAAPHWVGLGNYRELLASADFRHALRNTVEFTLLSMTIGPGLGLASALLLNQRIRFRGFFRTAYFLPVITSLVVVATTWKIMLNDRGIVNDVLRFVGLPGHAWLADPSTALPSMVAASVWQGFGFETVVFLAALQSIPSELYDAASVDGAGAWARFRYVTLPGLRPTVLFVFVIGIIGAFQVFDQAFVMTQGGPLDSTKTIVYYLVDRFQALELGKASAVAYLLLVILAAVSLLQFRLFSRRGDRTR
jgi:multiple sugar transport system permease protein